MPTPLFDMDVFDGLFNLIIDSPQAQAKGDEVVKLRPLTGATPLFFKQLQEMPVRLTREILYQASEVNMMGHTGILWGEDRDAAMLSQLNRPSRYGGGTAQELYERNRLLRIDFVQVAVWEQWRHHQPERFLKLCDIAYKTSKRGNTLYTFQPETTRYDIRTGARTKTYLRRYIGYVCPSTGKHYITEFGGMPVGRSRMAMPDRVMARILQLSEAEYRRLKIEA